ncbi:hypothetical protein ABTK17_19920, partial [Acinetobacter baumannii]
LGSYNISMGEALAAVSAARTNGFALRERGLVPGTKAVSVLIEIPSEGEHILAALTIAAVARRLARDRIKQVVARLQAAARDITL